MANYYISDLHLRHANVIRLDGRPFANMEEMESEIIRRWNERVTPQDTVNIQVIFAGRPVMRGLTS